MTITGLTFLQLFPPLQIAVPAIEQSVAVKLVAVQQLAVWQLSYSLLVVVVPEIISKSMFIV